MSEARKAPPLADRKIGQHFSDRRSQHQRDVKNKKPSNGLYAHLKENKVHKINWEGFVYLDSEKNWKRRKIKEAIYINAHLIDVITNCSPLDLQKHEHTVRNAVKRKEEEEQKKKKERRTQIQQDVLTISFAASFFTQFA